MGEGAGSAEELSDFGSNELDLGHYENAIAAFTKALSQDPKLGSAYAGRAIAFGFTNRLAETERDLAEVEKLIPADPVVHRIKALLALRRSDDKTAMLELTASLEGDPGNPFALEQRARLHQKLDQDDDAIADADAYVKAHPDHADAYVLMANLYLAQEKSAFAIAEAEQLLKLFPEDAYASAAAARIFGSAGERKRAFSAISRSITLDPSLFYYRLIRSNLRDYDDVDGRRSDLKAALELDPRNLQIITNLGLLDARQDRWKDAIGRFSEVLDKEPKDFGLLAYRSMAYLKAGDEASARRDYDAAFEVSSGPDDFSLICRSFAREDIALDWGEEACDRAVRAKPDEGVYRENRGLLKLRRGQFQLAVDDYDVAVGADKRSANGYFGRAIAKSRLGQEEGANADRMRAMSLDPTILDQYRDLGFEDF